MLLRLDPWAAEYNTAYHAQYNATVTDNAAKIDAAFESPLEAWQPVIPEPQPLLWPLLLFLDGSRRIEARVLLESDDRSQLAFGALGSYAVGAVSCCPEQQRRAAFVDAWDIGRLCTLGNGFALDTLKLPAQLPWQQGTVHYQVQAIADNDADAVVRALQQRMLEAEKNLAQRLSQQHQALIICDGPRPLLSQHSNVVGYLKTIHDLKITPKQLEVVRRLEQGQRSPLYLVSPSPEQQYVEWFLRLRDPRPWLYSLAGMVRLQAYAGLRPQREQLCQLADWLSILLPRYASRQHQDPRAPQQLLPIHALEAELKRRMGSAPLLRRRITQYLSEHN